VLGLAGPAAAAPLAVSAPALPPSVVLTKYAAAMALAKEPQAFSFEYALDQSGVHNLSSRHRVYRSGATERDETIAINGQQTRRPEVRIFRNRPNRYELAKIAPREDAYIFMPAGTIVSGKHRDYSFRLTPYKPQAFRVDRIIIDGVTFLPRSLSYTMHAGANVGTGTLVFGKSDKYWMIGTATASVGDSREKIVWSGYRFISAMPRETFAEPKPVPSVVVPLVPGGR
jgi:hypothetical protein